jgi:hypothetical protein
MCIRKKREVRIRENIQDFLTEKTMIKTLSKGIAQKSTEWMKFCLLRKSVSGWYF